jgi:SAM-dependent methyltransferase
LPLFFALTLFLSAFLLFLVQPMIGKVILPKLGGTPAVWNTCMVFFQATLLAGYGYTHSLSTYLKTRTQLLVHTILLCLPLIVLLPGPFNIGNWIPPTEANPIPSVLLLLTVVVGLPFFVVATSAPLLQKWFASTGHAAGKDPYYLYGASNLGSMLALLLYPILVEPYFSLRSDAFSLDSQNWFWTAGYVLLAGMIVCCAAMVLRAPEPVATAPAPEAPKPPEPKTAIQVKKDLTPFRHVTRSPIKVAPKKVLIKKQAVTRGPHREDVTWLRRVRWIALAAIPSSVMLGITTYLSTDVAAIPLFWILPLALYLLSFILVFMRWPVVWTGTPHTVVVIAQPFVLIALLLIIFKGQHSPLWLPFSLNLLVFFSIALVCHGELAKDRPTTKYLTEFFLWMSVGGMLGGMFNALLAPLIFVRPIEYQIMMAVACALRPTIPSPLPLLPGDMDVDTESRLKYLFDVLLGVALFVLAAILVFGADTVELRTKLYRFCEGIGFDGDRNRALSYWGYLIIAAGIPLVFLLTFSGRPLRMAIGVGGLLLAWGIYDSRESTIVHTARSFFGPIMVREDTVNIEGKQVIYRTLIHGGIDHGRQRFDEHRQDPIAYFHPNTPIGNIFRTFTVMHNYRAAASIVGLGTTPLGPAFSALAERPFAVVGLGTGTLAAYARPFQHVTFYEIDPEVKRMSLPDSGEKGVFTYLQDALQRGAKLEVIMGDGRLSLRKAPQSYYKVMVLDAFSSDAIPVHILTRDAVREYLDHLAPDGILIFNITNRYVNLIPVLADIAKDLGLECWQRGDSGGQQDHYATDWVILARSTSDFTRPAVDAVAVLGVGWGARDPAQRSEWALLTQGLNPEEWVVPPPTGRRVWTDDYSNLLSVLSW